MLAVALAAILSLAPAFSQAKTWNLRFTGSDFEGHPSVANGFLPWIRDVEKATNGQVKIRYFNPNTICPVNELVSGVEKGVVDIITVDHSRFAGRFPIHDVFALPLLSGNSVAHGIMCWRIFQETPALQEEMKSMKILGYWGGGNCQIMTKDKPVTKLEDMKGLRIACPGKAFADVASALGADPIIIPVMDTYMALSRSSADSMLGSELVVDSIKVQEMLHHVTLASLIKGVRFVGINWKVWNSFPPEIQKAIESTCLSEAFAVRISDTLVKGDLVGHDVLTKAGATFYTLEPEEYQRWVKACSGLDKAWVDRVVKAGALSQADAEALLAKVRTTGAEVTRNLDQILADMN